MALTSEQEQKITELLAAFENGKRISDLSDAQGAVGDMQIDCRSLLERGEQHADGSRLLRQLAGVA